MVTYPTVALGQELLFKNVSAIHCPHIHSKSQRGYQGFYVEIQYQHNAKWDIHSIHIFLYSTVKKKQTIIWLVCF